MSDTTMPTMLVDAPEPHAESSNAPRIRATKRKLDDAFQSLDDAVCPSQQPPPPKRTHTIRSLYSTLAKYGIKANESKPASSDESPKDLPISKSTPHLTAILTRAATRTRKALPFKFSNSGTTPAPPLPPTAEYRPSSIPAFLSRLATFKLATYANKPPTLDAVAAAKCGWINDGKDRLVCGLCKSSWVVTGRDGMNRDAANALLEKQRQSLVDMHKDGCPWKARQCDPSIYRIPLQTPSDMVRDIKSNAITLNPLLQNVEIKHPLTSTQLTSLRSTLSSFTLPSQTSQESDQSEHQNFDSDVFMSTRPEPAGELSDSAILTSLFGWSLVPVAPRDSSRRVSLSRATSMAPSHPPTPSLSRASSAVPMTPVRRPSLQPPTTPSTPIRIPSTSFTFRMPSNLSIKGDTTLLQCALCQRRVGLWAFAPQPTKDALHTPRKGPADLVTPSESVGTTDSLAPTSAPTPEPVTSQSKKAPAQRQFDLLKEHRSYCPYVVRSTVVPSPPLPPTSQMNEHTRSSSSHSQLNGLSVTGAVEGWRAVLTVILRYGAGQRQRLGLDFTERLSGVEGEQPMEVDGVKAMVAGVKSRGGKDLLRYVKGLLG